MNNVVTFADVENLDELEQWALSNCKTFAYRTITDVSDLSMTTDTVYDFVFGSEADAVWFKLRWS